MSVSLSRCCMFVSCVHSLAVLQFVNAGRGCKRRPYGRGILQSGCHEFLIGSYDCLIGSHECLLLFTPPASVSDFIICSGMCACTEVL